MIKKKTLQAYIKNPRLGGKEETANRSRSPNTQLFDDQRITTRTHDAVVSF